MQQLDWVGLFKRYVGNEIKTPYFVAVSRLTLTQANNEIFVYALFTAVFCGVIGTMSLSPTLPHGNTLSVSIISFGIMAAAIAFGFSKNAAAAAVCATAPVAALVYFALFGFHPNAATGDKVLQLIIVTLWLRYSWRMIQIARAYPTMLEPETPDENR
jgi:membrane associated rhomboid family serine protease